MEKLSLSIKRNDCDAEISADYDIRLGNWILGAGVTNFNLDMPARGKPVLKITCELDDVDIVLRDVITQFDIAKE
ncbi:hypothetical protein ACVPPR_07435 [Dellaglioa sp. L3N]